MRQRGLILEERIMSVDMSRAEPIKASIQATRERRRSQGPMVIELKLQNLSKKQLADLNRVFLEAKWFYNWLLEDLQNRLKLDAGQVSKRVKRLQRILSRKKKGSRNYEHARHLLRKEYERLNNRKKDIQNKLLAFLKRYPTVALQDDQVKGWQGGLFGGKVHSTAIGGLKARLKQSLATLVVLEPYETTSRECFQCGTWLSITLSDREAQCSCGWKADRDHNAALVILRRGLASPPKVL